MIKNKGDMANKEKKKIDRCKYAHRHFNGDINDTWYVKMAHRMMQQRRKSSIELKEGDRFQQAWKGCKEPMWFKVLNIDRPNNSLRVECHGYNGGMHEEEWDDLDVTESAFDVGEYKMIEDKED